MSDAQLDGRRQSSDPPPSLSAPEVVEQLILRAEAAGASDIHLQMRGGAAEVGFRLDGVITSAEVLPEGVAERVFGRIKYLARLKTYQESLPQDGRINKRDVGSGSDIRVATYPTVSGEKIVLRLFQTGTIKSVPELEFPSEAREHLENFLSQSSGLLLLTGPAGSGKTTTIYACLQALAAEGNRHIITIEDPVEQIVPGIMQTEVNEATGLSFAVASRHLLRQDPQVLAVGEIRDEETAGIVVRASLTGHLVISTLHAGSCVGVLERLTVLCPDISAVASSVRLILNQRLIRRFCGNCGGKGCSRCLQSGFRGRIPIVEFLEVTPGIRRQVERHELGGVQLGISLRAHAEALIRADITSEAEIARVLGKAK
jgi:type II secretory ATPase GspE/PulE/Tfp pilus assembly ATPase PilB-like protein